MSFLYLQGKSFGRLKILSRVHLKNGKAGWLCLCKCGEKRKVMTSNLTNGHSQSCGCLTADTARKNFFKHGKVKTRAYQSWEGIYYRCSNKNATGWKNYGGRGIKICERWRNFKHFYKDMGDCPEGMTIERIDNNGDYEPRNCRWATYKEQGRNKRNNVKITIGGVTKNITDWIASSKFSKPTVYNRIKNGFSYQEALGI